MLSAGKGIYTHSWSECNIVGSILREKLLNRTYQTYTEQKKDHWEIPFDPYNSCSTGKSSTPLRYKYIPVDFIKSEVKKTSKEEISNNLLLDFKRSRSVDTGEVSTPYKEAKYQNLIFKIYDNGRIFLSGSLHKYYNEGIHNYNDFYHWQYMEALERLKMDFGILPENIMIQTLEYGVNVCPPILTDLILSHCLIHKRERFKDVALGRAGRYKQAEHGKYILKLYDKARQYGLPHQLMRIEVKQTNWSEYRVKGIKTLHDFNQCDKLPFVKNLIGQWNKVIFYDPTNPKNGKKKKYSNVLDWERLAQDHSRQTYNKHEKKLKQLNTTGRNVQKLIADLILENIIILQE